MKKIALKYPSKLIDVITKKKVYVENVAYCCWPYCWSIYEEKNEDEVFDIMCKYTNQIGFRYVGR